MTSHDESEELPSQLEFQKVVQSAAIQELNLLQFNCSRQARFTPPQRWVISCTKAHHELVDHLNVEVVMAVSGVQDEVECVRFKARYQVKYGLDGEDLNDQAIAYFAKMNAPFNAYPYFRELVDSHARKMGLSSLIMPLWKPEFAAP